MNRPLLHAVALSLVLCACAVAQSGSGDLAGNVTDTAGAAVATAKVTVQSQSADGVIRSTETTSTGDYAITSLRPGLYTVRVVAAGFAVLERSGVTVKTGQRERLDFTLRPGAANDVVT